MHVSVRELRPGDHDAIGRVFVEAAQAAWAHFIPPEGLAGQSLPPERWKRETVLVYESAGGGSSVLWCYVRRAMRTQMPSMSSSSIPGLSATRKNSRSRSSPLRSSIVC